MSIREHILEVDKVANKVADTVANMVADIKKLFLTDM